MYNQFQRQALETWRIESLVPKKDITEQAGAQIRWNIHRTWTRCCGMSSNNDEGQAAQISLEF